MHTDKRGIGPAFPRAESVAMRVHLCPMISLLNRPGNRNSLFSNAILDINLVGASGAILCMGGSYEWF